MFTVTSVDGVVRVLCLHWEPYFYPNGVAYTIVFNHLYEPNRIIHFEDRDDMLGESIVLPRNWMILEKIPV